MRRLIIGSLAAWLVAAAVAPVWAEPKKPEGAAAKDQKEALDKMVSAGEVVGKLTGWGDGNHKTLTLHVTLTYQVPNADAIKNILNLKQQQNQILTNAGLNPLQKQQQLAQNQTEIAKNQANAFTKKEETKTVELQVGDEMKVRLSDPPVAFDEKGKPKKYTAKELRELKGDSKLPGFPADMSNLANDQLLQVQLVVPKKKTVSKEKDDKTAENKLIASVVVILSDGPKK